MKTLLSVVVGATLALAAIGAHADGTFGERQVALEIESMSLATALDKWAQQSGFQIFVQDWEATKNLAAPSLKGTFTAEAALEQLLEGTSLTYMWISDKAVAIRKKPLQTTPAALQRTGLDHQSSVPIAKFAGDDVGGAGSGGGYEAARAGRSEQTEGGVGTVEEVIVTGTHIGGIQPVGAAVTVYTRKDIDQSGATTLEQFARTMTENFASIDSLSNPNSNANLSVTGAAANFFAGSDFNLHGLGPGTTLTLLNGRRLASAGAAGDFVDVSMVPLSAVERIEVIADGASAIYGSDAVSGVVNIITKRDFSGAETRVQYGGATEGGAETFSASQLLGAAWERGNVMANFDYNWSGGLDASKRDYIPDLGGPNGLLPKNRRASAFVSGGQALAESTRLSGTAIYSERDFSFHQTRDSTIIDTSTQQEGDARLADLTLAIDHEFSSESRISIAGSHSRLRQESDIVTEFSIAPTGHDTNLNETSVTAADVIADGSLFSWRGGTIKGALGAAYHSEKFEQLATVSTRTVADIDADRHVTSAFAELFVPIVGDQNGMPLLRRLDLSAAVRYDDYSDFGSTVNPKYGLVWSPLAGLDVRGTYGTSFRAPLLLQVNQVVSSIARFFPNPAAPGGRTDTLLVNGGNTDLRAEEARTFTAGFAVQPPALPSLRIAVDYFNIRYRDRIQTPPFDLPTAFVNPVVAPFINRQPSLAEVQSYFSSPAFRGDLARLGPAGVGAILDTRFHNIAVTEQSGVSFRGSYDFQAGTGDISLGLNVDRLLDNEFQVAAAAPEVSIIDAFAQPTKLKGRANLAWSAASFTAAVAVNYVSKYDNTLFQPARPIDSWTTGDLYLTYDVGAQRGGLLRNMKVALNVINVTNEEPPHVDIPANRLLPGQQGFIPFDSTNASPVGRLISLSIGKRW